MALKHISESLKRYAAKPCAHKFCKELSTNVAILHGNSVKVCEEHRRTTDLGNWQFIEFTEWIECRKCGDEVEVPLGKKICWQCTIE